MLWRGGIVSRIAAILLAAGESRRMGNRNKLTLMVGGEPLLTRSARVLMAARVAEVVVVLGHEAELAASLVADLPVTTTVNAAYREGQMTSVHHGLAELHGTFDGVLIALADQPRLEPEDVDHLIDAFDERQGRSILVPTYEGQRGNPILLDWRHRDAILAGERNLGCRRLIERCPEEVLAVPMANDHVVVDLDTPADLQRLEEQKR